MGNRIGSRGASTTTDADIELRESARLASNSLSRCAEVNLFLVPVLGVDVYGFASRFCAFAGFTLVEPDARHAHCHSAAVALQQMLTARGWESPTAAAEYIIAAQLASVVMSLPHERDGGGGVRVFTRSPAEDRHVVMPLLLDGRVDPALNGLLECAVETAWLALQEQCAAQCSCWVYLRLTDAAWTRMIASHGGAITAEELERMTAWRASMDAFFYESPFRFTRHTLVVELHSESLSVDAVVHDAVDLVAGFVLEQVAAGMWSADIDRTAFRRHLTSDRYQRARLRQAVHMRAPPPPLTALSINPTAVVDLATPRRVDPHRRRAGGGRARVGGD